jgi:hypothetical protein
LVGWFGCLFGFVAAMRSWAGLGTRDQLTENSGLGSRSVVNTANDNKNPAIGCNNGCIMDDAYRYRREYQSILCRMLFLKGRVYSRIYGGFIREVGFGMRLG